MPTDISGAKSAEEAGARSRRSAYLGSAEEAVERSVTTRGGGEGTEADRALI